MAISTGKSRFVIADPQGGEPATIELSALSVIRRLDAATLQIEEHRASLAKKAKALAEKIADALEEPAEPLIPPAGSEEDAPPDPLDVLIRIVQDEAKGPLLTYDQADELWDALVEQVVAAKKKRKSRLTGTPT